MAGTRSRALQAEEAREPALKGRAGAAATTSGVAAGSGRQGVPFETDDRERLAGRTAAEGAPQSSFLH